MAKDLNLICTTQPVAQAKPNSDQTLHPSLTRRRERNSHSRVRERLSLKFDLYPKFGRYERYARLPIRVQMFDRAITYDPTERLLQRNRPRELSLIHI